ncbi:calcitonin gene-related peptide type 1 receptor [Lingula anatina]|uniref:Calcitonin gene-related peptide type 1 receptor n=1 Tax=Lingula anatina TaxID=7574 RepID=A0A1S3HUP5_LINAN|nr:calcitonin gene-related peptide type 1 receptor [Lingula anatina]XP_013389738.1 calcitonin gene-related peptide type 1 receptor [Lingula anatina]|eukprot:XP_013389737.1 calcitonin gene-related peptide type 1 receptor [Lingula anatina]
MIAALRMILVSILLLKIRTSNSQNTTATPLCRHRSSQYFPPDVFNKIACADCFGFLYEDNAILLPGGPYLIYKDTLINGSIFSANATKAILADIENKTKTSLICSSLESWEQCDRWRQCCQEAARCCDKLKQVSVQTREGYCPYTWDGWLCWDSDVRAGSRGSMACPGFVEHVSTSELATKTCTDKGTWWRSNDTNQEWTNYSSCITIGAKRDTIYVRIACNAVGIVALVPAVIIFLSFKQLSTQHRVQIHVNLFISFILTGVIYIILDSVVFLDRLSHSKETSIIYKNHIGCKILYMLTRYIRMTNYTWMFLEGFYLHRLIVRTFQTPKKIWWIYPVGWGFPLLPVAVYSLIKASSKQNRECWVPNMAGFEWIIYTPNLLSLVMNLFFLCNILRILLTQLQRHPNEPSNYRRGLKATFVLVPLFGLQLLAIIYRPQEKNVDFSWYEILSAVLANTQGFLVALIFCFFNGEVIGQLRQSAQRHKVRRESRRSTIGTMSTALSFRNQSYGGQSEQTFGQRHQSVGSAITLRHCSLCSANYTDSCNCREKVTYRYGSSAPLRDDAIQEEIGGAPDSKTNIHNISEENGESLHRSTHSVTQSARDMTTSPTLNENTLPSRDSPTCSTHEAFALPAGEELNNDQETKVPLLGDLSPREDQTVSQSVITSQSNNGCSPIWRKKPSTGSKDFTKYTVLGSESKAPL